jgi:predicted N-formylglutamate amidohydrolase
MMSSLRDGGDDDDLPPFLCIAGSAASGIIVLCDHASNRVPRGLGDLGLPAAEFERHIAYDPGAAAVTRALAAQLDAPAIMTTFSRLVIDPNRGTDDPTLVMQISDGTVVPGNARIDEAGRQGRIARFYEPYHAAIDAAIEHRLAAGIVPALVSVHSFTPVWRGRARPWQVGILWDRDPRLATALIAALEADSGLVVGDNEPYSGALTNDTMFRHGTRRGIAHALIELRQDLIADDQGAESWAGRLAAILREVDKRPEIHEFRSYGSRSRPVGHICGRGGRSRERIQQ